MLSSLNDHSLYLIYMYNENVKIKSNTKKKIDRMEMQKRFNLNFEHDTLTSSSLDSLLSMLLSWQYFHLSNLKCIYM